MMLMLRSSRAGVNISKDPMSIVKYGANPSEIKQIDSLGCPTTAESEVAGFVW